MRASWQTLSIGWSIVALLSLGCSKGEGETPVPAAADGATASTAPATGPQTPLPPLPLADPGPDPSSFAPPLPQAPIAEKHPRVKISTSHGDVVVELDAERCPATVENFLSYAKRRHYDNTIVHQVIADYIVLGGGYDEQFTEKPVGSPIRNEANSGLRNQSGTIAMARAADDSDSATAPFFFNLGNNASLDHAGKKPEQFGYCAFGQVIEGLEVLERIAQTPVRDVPGFESTPTQKIVIREVTLLR